MPELGEWAVAVAASPLVFLVVYAVTTIDGFFPPVPSETVVVALAALSAAGGQPDLWLLGAVAAAGAFSGDQAAYTIGRRLPVRRLRILRSARAQGALTWAQGALVHRGAALILAARFVPVGRVAVNMTAGTVRFARVRFTWLVALAAVAWAAWSVLLGVGAGHLLEGRPLLGAAVGAVVGLVSGALVDRLLERRLPLRGGPAATRPDPP